MARLDRIEGVEVNLGSWEVTEEFVRDYLNAVGDGLPVYFHHGLVPPVALAARALGSLLEHLELPPGAIHSLQEIETIRPVPFGQEIRGTAVLGHPKRRGGMEFITTGFTLEDREGRQSLAGKSTVLVVDPSIVSSPRGEPQREGDHARSGPPSAQGKEYSGEGTLPAVPKTITQEQLDAYARVSGDRNPLHLDAGFAATTQFGGIIAHGMLTLAFISEMMAAAFDRVWLETGVLKVRFKGAAYPGDQVQTRGRVTQDAASSGVRQAGCAVGLINRATDQELITGTTSFRG
jgi:3-hydroxybutyryl-CoA dehydratase